MKTIKASVAIKSADIILEQNGECFGPVFVSCLSCPLQEECNEGPISMEHRVKLLNELRGK